MLFSKPNKNDYAVVQALDEPSFIFNEDGSFVTCNATGQSILTAIGHVPQKEIVSHDSFVENLQSYVRQQGGKTLKINEGLYEIASCQYKDGLLLRLMPKKADDYASFFSSAINILPWGLLTVDLRAPKPTIVFSNDRAGEFLEIPSANMIGAAFADVMRVAGVQEDLTPMVTMQTTIHYDHEHKASAKISWYRFHFIPCGQDGLRCLIVIEDRSESKIMEHQYYQSQRLESLGQLAGGVAHDFNNILSIVDGYARIAKKASTGNEEVLNYLGRITQAVERGSALTGQLLTFGRHKVVKETVTDLGRLVHDQEPLIRPLMDASIALSFETEENVYIDVAPDHICQILLNLCINSRDAIPNGGNVIIEAGKLNNEEAFLRVVDTGCGMTPMVRAKMFDPFFTTKDQGKGTGLGLSMVYGLVKDMKGDISVITKIDSGTSITINLPLSLRPPPLKHIDETEDGEVKLNGYTALVAEDEPALLDLVSGMLEEMGMNVLRASNGNEALLVQEDYEGDIDFLLTDVVMPELNGVKLAELFESVRPMSKIMFMSGYPANGQMARVPLPEGAFFMSKPVDFTKLGQILKSMTLQQNDKNLSEKWKVMTGQWRSA